MLQRFILIVIFLCFASSVEAATSSTPPPPVKPIITKAKIRGDGALIGKDNLIIGIRNAKDPRANEYEFFYYGVSPEGEMTDYSVYKVYQNPATKTPDFLQETLIEIIKDYSKIIETSKLSPNAILVYDDKIFFNGQELASGAVAEGGIVTLVKGSLYYNGTKIESGTVVYNGQIIQAAQ